MPVPVQPAIRPAHDPVLLALRDFRQSWGDLLVFDILFRVIALAVLFPAVGWLFQRFVKSSGTEAVGNLDLVPFLLTPTGFALFLILVSLFAAISAMQSAGLMAIGYAASRGNRLTTVDVLPLVFSQIGTIAGLCFAVLGILTACAAPFAGILVAIAAGLLGAHDINYYLDSRPAEFRLALGLGVVVGLFAAAVILFVGVRLSLGLPEVLFRGKGVAGALRASFGGTRGRAPAIAKAVFKVILLWAVCSAVVNGVLVLTGRTLLYLLGTHPTPLLAVLGTMAALSLVLNALLSFAGLSLGCLVVVHVFRDVCEHEGIPLTGPQGRGGGVRQGGLAIGRRGLLAASLGVLVLATLVTVGLFEGVAWEDRVEISAHRGSSAAAPENTLAAIRRAIADGADYAEIDVQRTSDGVVVVAHDADLMRVGGNPAVIRRTPFRELAKVDVGRRFGQEFAGERIPTLEEVIATAKGRIKLIVELKAYGKTRDALAADVVAAFRKHELYSEAVVMSLSYADMREIARRDGRIVRGFIASAALGDLSRLDVDFVAVPATKATNAFIAGMHAADKEVFVWTVDKPKTMSLMIDRGVDNIITNHPARLRQVLEERAELGNMERILLRFRGLYL